MKRIYLVILLLTALLSDIYGQVVQREIKPTIDYSRTPRTYYIGNITVDGINNYDDYLLIGLSGLTVGQPITIPSDEITKAVKRYWRNGLFSNVSISVDSLVNDSVYLHIQLAQRPRISQINYNGVRKNERDDLQEKLGLIKDNQMTPNMLDRAKLLCKRYFEEKGFKNAEVSIMQRDDASQPDKVILDVNVDKKGKVKVHKIYISGNEHLTTAKIKGNLIKPGILKKIHEKGSIFSFLPFFSLESFFFPKNFLFSFFSFFIKNTFGFGITSVLVLDLGIFIFISLLTFKSKLIFVLLFIYSSL